MLVKGNAVLVLLSHTGRYDDNVLLFLKLFDGEIERLANAQLAQKDADRKSVVGVEENRL